MQPPYVPQAIPTRSATDALLALSVPMRPLESQQGVESDQHRSPTCTASCTYRSGTDFEWNF